MRESVTFLKNNNKKKLWCTMTIFVKNRHVTYTTTVFDKNCRGMWWILNFFFLSKCSLNLSLIKKKKKKPLFCQYFHSCASFILVSPNSTQNPSFPLWPLLLFSFLPHLHYLLASPFLHCLLALLAATPPLILSQAFPSLFRLYLPPRLLPPNSSLKPILRPRYEVDHTHDCVLGKFLSLALSCTTYIMEVHLVDCKCDFELLLTVFVISGNCFLENYFECVCDILAYYMFDKMPVWLDCVIFLSVWVRISFRLI